MIFSCIIPAKDPDDPKLADLIDSIRAQDFPQDEIEIIVVTEGDSESAKAIGIRKAQGEICAMFCADNYIWNTNLFNAVKGMFSRHLELTGIYSKYYASSADDNSLNRYFSRIGSNDPIAYYLGKCDRKPHYDGDDEVWFEYVSFKDKVPSLGDNGFFYRRSELLKADLDHYYPMDCAEDLRRQGRYHYIRFASPLIWHRTSDNLISFLIKRYRYARDLYSDRTDRRWRIIDNPRDYARLGYFIVSTLLGLPALVVSIKGFSKVRDWAWFWHWPVCIGFLITYSILAIRNWIKHGRLFQCPTSA